MKVRPAEVARLAKNPPKGFIAALAFGPDAGLVHEVTETLLKSVVDDLTDPFRVCDLDEAIVAADPARLADETAAISMFGGRRVVRVRTGGGGAGLTSVVKTFLADPKGDALVVIEAGDLAKSSPLRKLFEEDKSAAAIACYADTPRDVAEVVRATLAEAGLSITSEALADAVSRLGADRGMTRRELEKLALYAHGQKEISLADVRAVMGDEAEARLDEACDAAGCGDLARLDLTLERLWSSDASPIAVVRAALGHYQRLLQVKSAIRGGDAYDAAVRSLRPPVHFSRATSFRGQVQGWNETALTAALDRLLEAEALCKTTAVPAQAVCGRVLFEVAAMARRRG